ncbi:hypothetical protein E4U55_004622 [Claviceps digitariae]|nr:hypothetical protein E4U55_004622 [Claviceps digitariae]
MYAFSLLIKRVLQAQAKLLGFTPPKIPGQTDEQMSRQWPGPRQGSMDRILKHTFALALVGPLLELYLGSLAMSDSPVPPGQFATPGPPPRS